MPTPSYAAPHTANPGKPATAARIRATRSRWPTVYCGSAPPHRVTRLAIGAPWIPVAAARSAAASAASSVSSRWSTASSPTRPTEQRMMSTGSRSSSRCGHLTVENVTALTARPSTAGTRNPLPCGTAGNAERR